jgi:hypothetical protein
MDRKDCGVSARFSRVLIVKSQVGVFYVTFCRYTGI